MMKNTLRQVLILSGAALILTLCGSCESTAPTAAELDSYVAHFRQVAQPQYDELARQRASGELSQADYERSRTVLDHRVAKQADDMALSRHMLAQSEMKSLDIPTPDRPVELTPPVMGMGRDTLYRPAAQQFGQQAGSTTSQLNVNRVSRFNRGAQPGTQYDD